MHREPHHFQAQMIAALREAGKNGCNSESLGDIVRQLDLGLIETVLHERDGLAEVEVLRNKVAILAGALREIANDGGSGFAETYMGDPARNEGYDHALYDQGVVATAALAEVDSLTATVDRDIPTPGAPSIGMGM